MRRHSVGSVEEGDGYVRIVVPTRNRMCAPCALETNSKVCGGKRTVHLTTKDEGLALPAIPWLRVRVSSREWEEFIANLDMANLQGTINFHPLMIVPCVFPLLPLQPLCCCLPYQYAAGQALKQQNALNLCVAKWNRYVFMPRGIVVRRQFQLLEIDKERVARHYLRLDFVQQPPPLRHEWLPPGLRPGTMKSDLPELTRKEWLRSGDAFPCADLPSYVPGLSQLCALPQLIPTPVTYHGGGEPEIADAGLAAAYEQRTAEFSGGLVPDTMLRA